MLAKVGGNLAGLALAVCRQANKHMRLRRFTDAVVELGHVARTTRQRPDHLTKAPETATFFGDRYGKQRLALFAHLGALGDKAQTVEVHVGAAQNRGIGFALGLVSSDILLD